MKKFIFIFLLLLLFGTTVIAASSSSGRSSSFGSKLFSTETKNNSLYESYKSKYSAPSKPVIATDINRIFDRKARQERRTSYYTNYHVPSYAPPVTNYGMFDALMMWSILDNIGDRNMYYHHMNDPGFQTWRNDANNLCNQGNTEICKKLSDLDTDVNKLKAQGVKQDSTYITPGVDPDIYLSDSIKVETLGEIRICTGTASSDYSRFSQQFGDKTKLKIVNVPSSGSIDNLVKLANGTCDMAWAQSDTFVTDELVKLYELETTENTFLVCNNDANIKTINDIKPSHMIYIGNDQSGSEFTFNAIKPKLFKDASITKIDRVISASDIVNKQPNACLFTMTTSDDPVLRQLTHATMVPIEENITGYVRNKIPRREIKNIVPSKYDWFFSSGTPVLSVHPLLLTTKQWSQNNPIVVYDIMMTNRQYMVKEIK